MFPAASGGPGNASCPVVRSFTVLADSAGVMRSDPRSVFLYVDDGYPESSDYDCNYVALDQRHPGGLLRALLRLPPMRTRNEVRMPGAARTEGAQQSA